MNSREDETRVSRTKQETDEERNQSNRKELDSSDPMVKIKFQIIEFMYLTNA